MGKPEILSTRADTGVTTPVPSSWSLVPVHSGFQSDCVMQQLAVVPPGHNANEFRCVWSVSSGWGNFMLGAASKSFSIEPVAGTIVFKEIVLPHAGGSARVTLGSESVPVTQHAEGAMDRFVFAQPITDRRGCSISSYTCMTVDGV